MNGRLEEVGFSQFALADAAPSPEGVALVLSARGGIMKVACHGLWGPWRSLLRSFFCCLQPGSTRVALPYPCLQPGSCVPLEGGNRPLGACLPGLMRDFPGRKLLFSLGNHLIFLACCLPAWP